MSDAFEDQARALAHSIPVCDLGSTAGIRAIAIGLRETWRMARESRDAEVAALMEKADAFDRAAVQNYREMERLRGVIRPFGEAARHTFVILRESKPASLAIYDRVAAYYVSWVDYKRALDVMSGMGQEPAPALPDDDLARSVGI